MIELVRNDKHTPRVSGGFIPNAQVANPRNPLEVENSGANNMNVITEGRERH